MKSWQLGTTSRGFWKRSIQARVSVSLSLIVILDASTNIDHFTREDLKQIVETFQQDQLDGKFNDTASVGSDLDTSTGQIFDQVMQRPKKNSVLKRAQTKIAEDTELHQHIGATCLVTALN